MKKKIEIKYHDSQLSRIEKISVVDCIYLRTAENVTLHEGDFKLNSLGVSIKLPKGYEAIIVPRSSTFGRYGIIMTNSIGIIDESYSGNNDIWKLPVLATRTITIPKGTPIAQFEIVLSQKATVWQKLKWLFSNGIKLQRIYLVSNANRGGFGTVTEKKMNEKQNE